MRKVLQKSKFFWLTQETKASNGRKYYRISYIDWHGMEWAESERMLDIVDPFRNRVAKHGNSWKFSNKAECIDTFITLKLSFT